MMRLAHLDLCEYSCIVSPLGTPPPFRLQPRFSAIVTNSQGPICFGGLPSLPQSPIISGLPAVSVSASAFVNPFAVITIKLLGGLLTAY